MAEKNNPWLDELRKKTAPVNLDHDILSKVLKMNPQMRAQGQSTEQVGEQLLNVRQPA